MATASALLWQIWTNDALRSIGIYIPIVSVVLTLQVWRRCGWETRGTWWGLLPLLYAVMMGRAGSNALQIFLYTPHTKFLTAAIRSHGLCLRKRSCFAVGRRTSVAQGRFSAGVASAGQPGAQRFLQNRSAFAIFVRARGAIFRAGDRGSSGSQPTAPDVRA